MSLNPPLVLPHALGSHRTVSGIAYGAGAGALWGLVFLTPALVSGFGPLQLSAGRYLLYGLFALAMMAPRWNGVRSRMSRRQWSHLFWLALSGNILYYVLLSAAVQMAGIAITSLVVGFLPVAVTLIGSRDTNSVPLHRLMPSLLLCALGAVCIGWQVLGAPAGGSLEHKLWGLACALGALASWTAYAVGNARCLVQLERVSAHEWNLLTGMVTGALSLVLIPLALAFENMQHSTTEWVHFLGVCAAVAILASLVGNAFWNRMSRLLPLTLVGQMILFETFFALVYGWLWESRLPAWTEIAAVACVMLSVILCLAAHRPARRAQA